MHHHAFSDIFSLGKKKKESQKSNYKLILMGSDSSFSIETSETVNEIYRNI